MLTFLLLNQPAPLFTTMIIGPWLSSDQTTGLTNAANFISSFQHTLVLYCYFNDQSVFQMAIQISQSFVDHYVLESYLCIVYVILRS